MSATRPADLARSHHPSVRACLPVDRLRARVTDVLDQRGVSWAEVAAGILEARGRAGLDQVEFARRAGVDIGLLRRAEAGELSREELPGCLRRMVPR